MSLPTDARRALADFWHFATAYWGLELFEKPHRAITDIIQEAEEDEARPYTQLVIPRYWYKSSIGRAKLAWTQLRQIHLYGNVYHRQLLASAKLSLSRESLEVIISQLRDNRKITDAFGPMIRGFEGPGIKQSKQGDAVYLLPRLIQGEIPQATGASIAIASLRRMGVGTHADELWLDDLNDYENSGTPMQRERVKKFYRSMYPLIGMYDRRGKRTRILMTGTMYHEDDVRGMIQREEREQQAEDPLHVSPWRIIQHGSTDEYGDPRFPEKFPLKTLEMLRQKMGVREYAHQFENEPDRGEGLIEEDKIRFTARDRFPALRDGRISVDPSHHSEAKALGCYCAMTVVAYDRYAKMYVLDARGSREWDAIETIRQLFALHEVYPQFPIFIEDSHMAGFRQAVAFEEAARSKDGRRVHLPIYYVPVDVKTQKAYRWQNLATRARMGTLYLCDEIAASTKLELKTELVKGEGARFVDFLDALAIADTGIQPRVSRDGQLVERPERPDKKSGSDLTFNDFFPEAASF